MGAFGCYFPCNRIHDFLNATISSGSVYRCRYEKSDYTSTKIGDKTRFLNFITANRNGIGIKVIGITDRNRADVVGELRGESIMRRCLGGNFEAMTTYKSYVVPDDDGSGDPASCFIISCESSSMRIKKGEDTSLDVKSIFIVLQLDCMSDMRKVFTGDKAGRGGVKALYGNLCKSTSSILAKMHAQNVVHRDIKVDNIVYCANVGENHFRLIDFGFAIELLAQPLAGRDREQPGAIAKYAKSVVGRGTVKYMHPFYLWLSGFEGAEDAKTRPDYGTIRELGKKLEGRDSFINHGIPSFFDFDDLNEFSKDNDIFGLQAAYSEIRKMANLSAIDPTPSGNDPCQVKMTMGWVGKLDDKGNMVKYNEARKNRGKSRNGESA